jgi:Protein of unknown function (DUF3375)
MDFETLESLRRSNTALKLIAADHMPLIASFLQRAFIQPNQRSLTQTRLQNLLEEVLDERRQRSGAEVLPKSARAYIDDWANGATPWLRKFYVREHDEPMFDLMPDTERALEWLRALKPKRFVGAESRLKQLIEILRELQERAALEVETRKQALERRKSEIEAELGRLERGAEPRLDPTQVRERFMHAEDLAHQLLSDFRQLERNLRELDRATRERFAGAQGARGAMLDHVFKDSDDLWDTDQGRSLRAFWELILSPTRQDELAGLVEHASALPEIQNELPVGFLHGIGPRLLDAATPAYGTGLALIEQLRKFVADQRALEGRRLTELIRRSEKHLLALRQHSTSSVATAAFYAVDDVHPQVDLPLTRALFKPAQANRWNEATAVIGESTMELEQLYARAHVDERELREVLAELLSQRTEVRWPDLLTARPLTRGLAEVVTWLWLASRSDRALIDSNMRHRIAMTTANESRSYSVPDLVFLR